MKERIAHLCLLDKIAELERRWFARCGWTENPIAMQKLTQEISDFLVGCLRPDVVTKILNIPCAEVPATMLLAVAFKLAHVGARIPAKGPCTPYVTFSAGCVGTRNSNFARATSRRPFGTPFLDTLAVDDSRDPGGEEPEDGRQECRKGMYARFLLLSAMIRSCRVSTHGPRGSQLALECRHEAPVKK
jgi:hypothetical protein